MGAPSGTVTFLFTDIEGSTRRWQDDPDAMRRALERHDALLRDAVVAAGGHGVKSTGDGMMAAFRRAADAVTAAASGQTQLQREGLPPVRMAIHTGDADERDGDYFGPTLNRAARLLAIGHGGQVLVSHVAVATLADAGVDLIDLGEHRLRDLAQPEHVHQLIVDGLRNDFAPLRSLDTLPTNLPSALTKFIGRDDEVARVRDAVRQHRLVTLTGVGGVGKTRLALQAAADLLAEYPDGVWVSELGPAGDADAMLTAVASTLDARQRTGMTLEASIAEAVRRKRMLWVVDNCEHLIEPVAGLVDRVLRAAPEVDVLATSREGLDVAGEHVIAVRSMAVAAAADPEVIAASDAVRLFADRASAVRDGFRVDEANARAVHDLCRRLDGIPLAIELAASRLSSLSVADITALLDERFRLLTGGRRASLERHATLRAAVDWSFSLLSDEERLVFTRLCVFAGSFDAPAAFAVVGHDLDRFEVLDVLDALVRKSMLAADERSGPSVRYQMLETLRQYAREQLRPSDGDGPWTRHAEYYAGVAEACAEGLLGPEELSWRARLDAELDNIRAAAQWALDSRRIDLVLRPLTALADEDHVVGPKLGRLATRALSVGDGLGDRDRFMLLAAAAFEAYEEGDTGRAADLAADAIALDAGLGADGDVALLLARGRLRTTPGITDIDQMASGIEAIAAWAAAAAGRPDLPDAVKTKLLSGIPTIGIQVGRRDLGRDFAARALAHARRSRNPSALGHAYYVVGAMATDAEEALDAYEKAIDLGRRGANIIGFGPALFQSALILARAGDVTAAAARLRESIDVLGPRGRTPELDGACGYALEILESLGRLEAVAVLVGAVGGGVLTNLRGMPMPRERRRVDVRGVRDALGASRFAALTERGAALTYDEVLDHICASLEDLPAVVGGAEPAV